MFDMFGPVFGGRANYSSTGFAFFVFLIFFVFGGRANYSSTGLVFFVCLLFLVCFCIWRECKLFLYRIGIFGI